jgi:hypothetical protein
MVAILGLLFVKSTSIFIYWHFDTAGNEQIADLQEGLRLIKPEGMVGA